MEVPLIFRRPEKERKDCLSLSDEDDGSLLAIDPYQRSEVYVSYEWRFDQILEVLKKRSEEEREARWSLFDQYQRSLLPKEESLEDVLKQLVQDRPGLLRRLRVKRVRPEDFPPCLKQQYSEMLLMDEEFLKDFCKELEQYREDPEPSCVSMKSDISEDYRQSFKQQQSKPEQDRADSPEPSCVSMKSDWSKDNPPVFKQQHSKTEQDRADPPEPSCVSMKTDRSKDYPPVFKRTEQDRADSPEPSRVSMKSNRSKDNPIDFKQQQSKVQQETSDVSTGCRSPLDSTFMFLEENIVGFVKKELKKFKEMLSPDYPECPEDQCEDEGVVDEEEAQRRYSSALVLKVTLLFMKRMNLGELADSLEKCETFRQCSREQTSQRCIYGSDVCRKYAVQHLLQVEKFFFSVQRSPNLD